MTPLHTIGAEWVSDQMEGLTDKIVRVSPVQFNEENRYLPESVSTKPGPIRYDVNPFMREILECFSVDSPVREIALMKGVQITWTTLLESGAFYYMAHVKTLPIMYMTADKELASARIENNFMPMLVQSEFMHIIQSSDTGNKRKTGKTENHIQFKGGGYMVPFGAKNADKMRQYSIAVLIKDEIDAWPLKVGKDGDPDKLSDDRCKGYYSRRKIFKGSTPLIEHTSKIDKAYKRGDQRHYQVLCRSCSYPQVIRWEHKPDGDTGIVGGFSWESEDGVLLEESVCYCCKNCGQAHYEYDKTRLFAEEHGAHWKPTTKPVQRDIRSYHLPAMYSPVGMQPWSACVLDYLDSWDVDSNKVKDIGKYQVFYNNILAQPFEIMGSKVRFTSVSAHRRAVYRLGEIPNKYAEEYSGSKILFLTLLVDVHKQNLAVSVMGWTRDARCYVIEYFRDVVTGSEDDCSEITSPVWGRLRELIEEKHYTDPTGREYPIALTLIDAGYANDTVTTFCADYPVQVYPIIGRDRPAKNQRIKEFDVFETQAKHTGYKITVDHYKDRIAPVLRREWFEDQGVQGKYHFNAPVDIPDKALKELTVETRVEEYDENGNVTYRWKRPGNARNELWDLLVYGHASVEILAWNICIQHFELETIDWTQFWDYMENTGLYFEEAVDQ